MMQTQAPPSALPKVNSEMDNALQKYLLLSGQQDQIRRRLTTTSERFRAMRFNSHSSTSSFFCSSPGSASGSSSPTFSPTTSAYPLPAASFGPSQFAPSQTSAIVDAHPSDASDDDVLYDINQAIKATLTELLNRSEVKHDEHLRAWVQGRLMDTQLELRRQRRRRSSASEGSVWKASPRNSLRPETSLSPLSRLPAPT